MKGGICDNKDQVMGPLDVLVGMSSASPLFIVVRVCNLEIKDA